MGWMRVFSACQALMVPTKFYRVTHKRAKEVIFNELGFVPKGKPGTPADNDLKGWRQGGEEAILDWLMVVSIARHKEAGCVQSSDITLLEYDRERVAA